MRERERRTKHTLTQQNTRLKRNGNSIEYAFADNDDGLIRCGSLYECRQNRDISCGFGVASLYTFHSIFHTDTHTHMHSHSLFLFHFSTYKSNVMDFAFIIVACTVVVVAVAIIIISFHPFFPFDFEIGLSNYALHSSTHTNQKLKFLI